MKSSFNNYQVRLRAMEPEDLEFLYTIENDMELWDIGITNVPYSRYALYNYLSECKNDIYTDHQLRLIVTSEQGECIGIVDLVNFDPKHLRAELGIVIQKKFRGQGYGKAAVRELLIYAHDVIHLHQLYAVVSVANQLSMRLFTQLGFEDSGILRDWLYNGDDWHDAKLLQFFYKKGANCLAI